jgi:hypothetical protein
MNYFLCKVSLEKTTENGERKKVAEQYVVDALSFTEAEARVTKELAPYVSGEFSLSAINRYPLAELFLDGNGERYYKAKLAIITLNEKTGKEKRSSFNVLSQASDIQQAKDVIVDGMKGGVSDYEIVEVKETQILDVFRCRELNDQKSFYKAVDDLKTAGVTVTTSAEALLEELSK